jgi:tetratricopeptide (TPR) repeat protein
VSTDYKFRAFISYSHKDEKWAAWLHKALETFKIPKYLVGETTAMGTVPERMGKVFRDREELSTSHSLGTELTQALEDSACQIVICSPNAANSHWTNEEILTYKRLGRENRIFCLIVDGEPNASMFEETAEFECFPKGLMYQMGPDGKLTNRRSEPIAADVRPQGDGKQNAKLKLISGMLGVGFDALKQREQQRRQRRMYVITAAAIVGMVVTSGLATMAVLARNEANVQRRQAEIDAETARQTTDFMVSLFSVSDPSEARGNTITAREILDQGAGRIEEELATQPTIQATLMDTMGSVYESLGLYPEAGNLLSGALVKRRELLGDENIDVALTKAHLAEVLTQQAIYDEAEPMYREALDTQRRLLGDEAGEVADTLVGFAELLTDAGRFEEAEVLLSESLEIRRAILGEEHLDVAKAMEDLGWNLFDQGDYDGAKAMLRESNTMRRRLLNGSPHPQLADGLNNLGLVLWDEGQLAEAEQLFREALAMNEVLLDEYHPTIAVNKNNLALLLHDTGDFAAAETMYRDVIIARRQTLGDKHPEVALALSNLAYLLFDKDDRQAAITMQREAIDIYRQLFSEGHPDLASSLGALGSWLSMTEDHGEAEPLLHESVDMRKSIYGDEHTQTAIGMTALAQLYLATGRVAEAENLSRSAGQILTNMLSEDHWRTSWAGSIEGSSLAHLKKFEAAEKLLLDSHAALQDGPGSGSRGVFIELTAGYLADLYRIWGKPEQAAKYAAMLGSDESR